MLSSVFFLSLPLIAHILYSIPTKNLILLYVRGSPFFPENLRRGDLSRGFRNITKRLFGIKGRRKVATLSSTIKVILAELSHIK